MVETALSTCLALLIAVLLILLLFHHSTDSEFSSQHTEGQLTGYHCQRFGRRDLPSFLKMNERKEMKSAQMIVILTAFIFRRFRMIHVLSCFDFDNDLVYTPFQSVITLMSEDRIQPAFERIPTCK